MAIDVRLWFQVVDPLFLFDQTQLSFSVHYLCLQVFHNQRAVCNLVTGHSTRPTTCKSQYRMGKQDFCELAIILVMDHLLLLEESPHFATGHLDICSSRTHPLKTRNQFLQWSKEGGNYTHTYVTGNLKWPQVVLTTCSFRLLVASNRIHSIECFMNYLLLIPMPRQTDHSEREILRSWSVSQSLGKFLAQRLGRTALRTSRRRILNSRRISWPSLFLSSWSNFHSITRRSAVSVTPSICAVVPTKQSKLIRFAIAKNRFRHSDNTIHWFGFNLTYLGWEWWANGWIQS